MKLIEIIKLMMDTETVAIYENGKRSIVYLSRELPYKYLTRKVKGIVIGDFELRVYF